MSDHPLGFNFAAALAEETDHPMIYTSNLLVGANPNQSDGYWDTEEEAIVNFAMQLSEMAHAAQRHFLFVRKAPELVASDQFEGGTKWRMIGRFSIAKLKENEVTYTGRTRGLSANFTHLAYGYNRGPEKK